MLAERRRALRALGDRSLTMFWLARLADRVGDWLFLLAVLVAAWNFTGNVGPSTWALAAWLGVRLFVWAFLDRWMKRLAARTWPYLVALKAVAIAGTIALVAMRLFASTTALLVATAVFAAIAALAARPRSAALGDRVGVGRLGLAASADASVDRAALLIGGLLAGALLFVDGTGPLYAWLAAIGCLLVAAALAYSQLRETRPTGKVRPRTAQDWAPEAMRAAASSSAVYLIAAFTLGALGAVLIVATLPIAGGRFGGAGAAPFLAAAFGLGLVLGPLPVARLLLRIPAPLLLLATTVALSAGAILIAAGQSFLVAVPALVFVGFAAVTQDALIAIAIRRLAPPSSYERVARLLLIALTVGQLYGAISVIVLTQQADPFAMLMILAVVQIVLVGIGMVFAGRTSLQIGGLSSLPIKSVVHKLSWDTRPAGVAADLSGAGPRSKRLAGWINRTVQLQELTVTLPISGRRYTIYRPDEASRERLFEQGREDPEKQMPYWAKVWPSGVALADVVVERQGEVSEKHVLELGAGLGVTASTVLEFGGHLVTADYSALPLAHCRLNTLVNTGRAPEATCFNWRHDAEVTEVIKRPDFKDGFPLIIAGDVLYEGRDAEPLLNVIERMLAADGSLWLAEPVRRTAGRFLDSAASLGWEIESRQVKAEWPDATDGPVNLHFLTRSPDADALSADLGGWRI